MNRITDLGRVVLLLGGFTGEDFLGGVETRRLGGNDSTGLLTKGLGRGGCGLLGGSLLDNREFSSVLGLDGPQTRCVVATPFLDGRHDNTKRRGRTTVPGKW